MYIEHIEYVSQSGTSAGKWGFVINAWELFQIRYSSYYEEE